MRGGDAGLVEIFATNSDAYAMDFLFVRTESGDEPAIGDFADKWNRRRIYKVNGVGSGGHAGGNTLGESAKVVGVGANPDGLVWIAAEVVVFESLADIGVNDRVDFGAVGAEAERITRGIRDVGIGWNDVCVGLERSASVRRGFSRGGDEIWWSHPRSLCGVGRNDVCVGPERSTLVRRGFSRGGDKMWRRHPRR